MKFSTIRPVCHFLLITVSCLPLLGQQTNQSFLDDIDCIPTNFTITSEVTLFETERQILVKRATGIVELSSGVDYAYAYGLGFEAYHLEFIARQQIFAKKRIEKKKNTYYEMQFFENETELLGTIKLIPAALRAISSGEKGAYYAYSISLKGIPLVLLDKTDRIDIVKIQAAKN